MRRWIVCLALFFPIGAPLNAEVKRVVVIKLDGVPEAVLERELARVDPASHKSGLPWIERVFEQGGTRLENFYVRAISLSAPSWSLLDTGQHLQIRGNAEFDRYTYHVYDYLNFFPFYLGYALSHKVDMPGVEVLDDLGIPLLADRFPAPESYQSFQLYQRGVRWKTLQHSLQSRFSHSLRQLLDEWTIGFEIGSSIEDQTERELIAKLADPRVRYLDYFTGDYDHVAHSTPDPVAQRLALQRIDSMLGRIWTAIEASPLAAQTVLVVVSDHGMNTEPGVYSQGYDLVQFFNSPAGGGHHVVTDRHPLTEYKLKGLDPFVSEVVTPSEDSLYLKGAANQYPTVLLDLDGNERASIYLRNSDLNALPDFAPADESFRHWVERSPRGHAGLLRYRGSSSPFLAIECQPARPRAGRHGPTDRGAANPGGSATQKWTEAEREQGLDKEARRAVVQLESMREQQRSYSEYSNALSKLLGLIPSDLADRRLTAADLIPKRVMGDANSIYDLQNYVVGPGPAGLVLARDGSLDFERSFQRIDYFPVLAGLAVRNNVQAAVGSHPVDFIALRIPRADLRVPPDLTPDEDAIWLYGSENRQALILARHDAAGKLELRYLPVCELRQDQDGSVRFESAPFAAGFPLKMFEDAQLAIPEASRREWLDAWHGELDWFHAVHRTEYSNAILALHEQFLRDPLPAEVTGDVGLLDRFKIRRRRSVEAGLPDFCQRPLELQCAGI